MIISNNPEHPTGMPDVVVAAAETVTTESLEDRLIKLLTDIGVEGEVTLVQPRNPRAPAQCEVVVKNDDSLKVRTALIKEGFAIDDNKTKAPDRYVAFYVNITK